MAVLIFSSLLIQIFEWSIIGVSLCISWWRLQCIIVLRPICLKIIVKLHLNILAATTRRSLLIYVLKNILSLISRNYVSSLRLIFWIRNLIVIWISRTILCLSIWRIYFAINFILNMPSWIRLIFQYRLTFRFNLFVRTVVGILRLDIFIISIERRASLVSFYLNVLIVVIGQSNWVNLYHFFISVRVWSLCLPEIVRIFITRILLSPQIFFLEFQRSS